MNEELHTTKWIVSQVESNTSMQAYFEVIPAGKPLPAVRFHAQARNDARGVGTPAGRILTTIDWLVVVVNEGLGMASLVPLADDLDDALHNQSGQADSVLILECIRLEPFSLLEPLDSGVQYRHAGGLYRTIVQGV